MRRGADSDGDHLWAIVAATVRPLPGRTARPAAASAVSRTGKVQAPVARRAATPESTTLRSIARTDAPGLIEPGLRRRLTSEREQLAARIDLHGLTQDGARSALTAFLIRRVESGCRSVLVITGKGTLGDGVLRRRVPEWLAEPPLRAFVAGMSEAHRRHGGAGSLYVALKRHSPG